jgi:8-oxo-dGTP diphosphatase
MPDQVRHDGETLEGQLTKRIKMNKRPLVGVAVIIMKDHYVLLGKRKMSHGNGTWALPGGHLEFNETIEECATREVFEETGLYIKNIQHVAFTNDIFKEDQKHYVTLFIVAEYDRGIPELKEPDKCHQWGWFSWYDLPEPKFLSLENLLNQGFDPEKLVSKRN